MIRRTINDNVRYPSLGGSTRHTGKLISESCERFVELHRRNPALSGALIGKLWRVQEVCTCPYTLELALCILSDLRVPGPQELAKRYRITKQAISKSILDSLAELDRIDRPLAKNMRRYAQGAVKGGIQETIEEVPDEPQLPEIDSVGLAHVVERWQLEDYLEGMAERIVAAHPEGEQLDTANMVRQALGAASRNFLRHTRAPAFKGYDEFKFIEALIDRLVYNGVEHSRGDDIAEYTDEPEDSAL